MGVKFEVEALFTDALYKHRCLDCSTKIEWEAQFDADGTTYYGTCVCDGMHWYMSPYTVLVSKEKND